jgi:hypothetical protein
VSTLDPIDGLRLATWAFELADLALEPEHIERVMRHDPAQPVGPFSQLVREALAEAESRCRIRAALVEVDAPVFDETTRTMRLGEEVFRLEKIVFGQVKKAERVAFFLCTAGPIGEWSRELARAGDPLRSYVVDVVGTEIVEFAVDRVHHALAGRMAERGMKITNRFSPGYCNWNVGEQRLLFGHFPEGCCGIRLAESCLMHPTKSVSGLIGIGTRVKLSPYLCNVCSDELCIYRDKRLLEA